MSNNKKSSVNFIEHELLRLCSAGGIHLSWNLMDSILNEAKSMHKEEIVKAYNQSWHLRDKPYETAEKYYNETFGGHR